MAVVGTLVLMQGPDFFFCNGYSQNTQPLCCFSLTAGVSEQRTYVTGGALMSVGFMTALNHCNKKCDILHGRVIKTLITP